MTPCFILTAPFPIETRLGSRAYQIEIRLQETSGQSQLATQDAGRANYRLLAFAGTDATLRDVAFKSGFDVPGGIGAGWIMERLCADGKARRVAA